MLQQQTLPSKCSLTWLTFEWPCCGMTGLMPVKCALPKERATTDVTGVDPQFVPLLFRHVQAQVVIHVSPAEEGLVALRTGHRAGCGTCPLATVQPVHVTFECQFFYVRRAALVAMKGLAIALAKFGVLIPAL